MRFQPLIEFGPFPDRYKWSWKEGCGYWCCSGGDGFRGYAGVLDCEWMTGTGIEVMALELQAGS